MEVVCTAAKTRTFPTAGLRTILKSQHAAELPAVLPSEGVVGKFEST